MLLDKELADYPLDGYRQTQLWHWIFEKGAIDFAQMSSLPADLREKLAQEEVISPFSNIEVFESNDGSTKYLFTLLDGQQTEAVFMPYSDRSTICISTMVGCPAGCTFCATGRLGFGRNLTSGEMIAQVIWAAHDQNISPREIRNLVFMGMGEPLLNYDNTLQAARTMLDKRALGMSSRRVTLSTVGLPKQIVRLAEEDISLRLAVSLHAPDEETRQRIVPTAHAHSIDEIIEAVRIYQQKNSRRVSFEYAMLKGVNDHLWQAKLLAKLLRGLIAHVNLIPMNPWEGSGFESSSENQIQAFYETLEDAGVPVSVRRSRGRDAGAACGQLALKRPKN